MSGMIERIGCKCGVVVGVALFVLFGESSSANLPRASYFFVHEKANRNSRLWVMQFVVSRAEPTGVRIIKKYLTQYGLNDEQKEREGDRNTPEGVYQVASMKRHRPDTRLGPWFFGLSYPNADDLRLRRTGSAIGIHGGPNRRTLGCIRLRDQPTGGRGVVKINELRQFVEIGTPVISMPLVPRWLKGEEGQTLGQDAAKFFAYLITTPLTNEHAVNLVRTFSVGSTDYLSQRDERLPQQDLVTVSSELDPFGVSTNQYTYRGFNLIDGDPATCWAEGSEGSGIGEWVQLRFPTPRVVRRIRIVNGYDKREGRSDRWEQNNRVKRATVELADGSSFEWDLRDTREWQELVLPAPIRTRFVQLTVNEIYRGSRRDWDDTSISELAVDAETPATAAASAPRMIAQASSYLTDGTAPSGYYAHNVIDGDPATCWSEGGMNEGIGEWVRVQFTQPRTIRQVRIINGYDKRQGRYDRWMQNTRVRTTTLRFSDGTTHEWRLQDNRQWQAFDLPTPVTTNYVQLTIESVYSGSEWEDASISELDFVDAPPSAATAAVPATSEGAGLPTVTASSSLDQETSSDYLPTNVFDGDPTTCWSEDAPNPAGEWIKFEFPSPRRINRIRLINGYDKRVGTQDRWEQNSRVRGATLRFGNGVEKNITLNDTRQWQSIIFPGGVLTNSVQIIIRSTYPGSQWRDASISEVEFDADLPTGTIERPQIRSVQGESAPPVVTASSTLSDPDPNRYAPANLTDGDPTTCWSEGVSAEGIGESVHFTFPAARTIRRIRLVNGYAKGDLWAKNNRVKTLEIRLSTGTSYTWNLADTEEWQTYTFPRPEEVTSIGLIIREATRGSVPGWRDTSLSEVHME